MNKEQDECCPYRIKNNQAREKKSHPWHLARLLSRVLIILPSPVTQSVSFGKSVDISL